MVWIRSSPTTVLICRFREAACSHQFLLCMMAETWCLLVPKCIINSIPCGILRSSIFPFSFSCFCYVFVRFTCNQIFMQCKLHSIIKFCVILFPLPKWKHTAFLYFDYAYTIFFFTARFCSDLTDFILFIVLSSLNNDFPPLYLQFLCPAIFSTGLFPFCMGWLVLSGQW